MQDNNNNYGYPGGGYYGYPGGNSFGNPVGGYYGHPGGSSFGNPVGGYLGNPVGGSFGYPVNAYQGNPIGSIAYPTNNINIYFDNRQNNQYASSRSSFSSEEAHTPLSNPTSSSSSTDSSTSSEESGEVFPEVSWKKFDIDLSKFPKERTAYERDEMVFGDLHGNWLVVLWTLIRFNILDMDNRTYKTLYQNFNKLEFEIFEVTEEDQTILVAKDHPSVEKSMEASKRIIKALKKVKRHRNNKRDIRILLLGDTLADRRGRDDVYIAFLASLASLNIYFPTTLSNHDIEFINTLFCYESERKKRNEGFTMEDAFFSATTIRCEQSLSLARFVYLFNEGYITLDEYRKLRGRIDEYYLRHLTFIDYAFYLGNEDDAHSILSIRAHAPVNLQDIKNLADILNIQYERNFNDVREITQVIDKINEKILRVLKAGQWNELCSSIEDELIKAHPELEDGDMTPYNNPAFKFLWGRIPLTELKLSKLEKMGAVKLMHGHTGGVSVYWEYNSYQGACNFLNLNQEIGKSVRSFRGEYFIGTTTDLEFRLENLVKEQPALKKISKSIDRKSFSPTKNEKVYEKIANPILKAAKLQREKQKRLNKEENEKIKQMEQEKREQEKKENEEKLKQLKLKLSQQLETESKTNNGNSTSQTTPSSSSNENQEVSVTLLVKSSSGEVFPEVGWKKFDINLAWFPEERTDFEGDEMIFGDLHGNWLVVIWTLVYFNILDMEEGTYNALYKNFNDLEFKIFERSEGEGQTNKRKFLAVGNENSVGKSMEASRRIISVLSEVERHSNRDIRILFLGDTLADRRGRDDVYIAFLERLASLNIYFPTTLSNHDIGFINTLFYYELERQKGTEGFTMEKAFFMGSQVNVKQSTSLARFVYLVDNNHITQDEYLDLLVSIDKYYLRHLTLIDYTFYLDNEDETNRLIIRTHAPVTLQDIEHLADILDIECRNNLNDVRKIREVIDQVNRKILRLLKSAQWNSFCQGIKNRLIYYYPELKGHSDFYDNHNPVAKFLWGRIPLTSRKVKLSEVEERGMVKLIHGHTGSPGDYENCDNIFNLNQEVGKGVGFFGLGDGGEYRIVVTTGFNFRSENLEHEQPLLREISENIDPESFLNPDKEGVSERIAKSIFVKIGLPIKKRNKEEENKIDNGNSILSSDEANEENLLQLEHEIYDNRSINQITQVSFFLHSDENNGDYKKRLYKVLHSLKEDIRDELNRFLKNYEASFLKSEIVKNKIIILKNFLNEEYNPFNQSTNFSALKVALLLLLEENFQIDDSSNSTLALKLRELSDKVENVAYSMQTLNPQNQNIQNR